MSDGNAEAIENRAPWVAAEPPPGPEERSSPGLRALALSIGLHLLAAAILLGAALLAPRVPRTVWVELAAPEPAGPRAVPGAPAAASPGPASPHRAALPKGAGAQSEQAPAPAPAASRPEAPSPSQADAPPSPASAVPVAPGEPTAARNVAAPRPDSPVARGGGGMTPGTGAPAAAVSPASGPAVYREAGPSGGGPSSGGESVRAGIARPTAGDGAGAGAIVRAPRALRDRIQSRVAYPAESIRQEEEGEVLLRVLVGADGSPREIRLHRSSGIRRLDEAARRGVGGAAPLPSAPGWYEVPVRFSLR